MEDLSKIKDRIAKLLAMAGDASSPEEAAIAAKRARALMDKHQIDEASISLLGQSSFNSSRVTKSYKYPPMWLDRLSVSVAMYNDCQAVREWDGSRHGFSFIVFRGMEADVAMAELMFHRLVAAVERWCKTYMIAEGYGSHYVASVGNAYKLGMQARLSAKLKELMTERDQLAMDAQGTSLVVTKTRMVGEHFGEASYANRKARVKDDQAFVKGWFDGGAVSINDEVE